MDVYEIVTNRIIEQLEQGYIPWEKPWTGVRSGAFNRITKRPYSLLNQMLLQHNGEYATFREWQKLGGHIRKGEKSEIVVFWKILEKEERNEATGEKEKKKIPMLRYYNVFHISQVEGVEPLPPEQLNDEVEPIEAGDKIITDYITREHLNFRECKSNKAYYSPSDDTVVVPLKEQYQLINEYYSTTFHELTHSTGHRNRLNRVNSVASFGSQDYSKEELVAEIGSATLMNISGIETPKTFRNSTAYVQNWLQVLRNDKKFIVSASSKAEKATKFILWGEGEA